MNFLLRTFVLQVVFVAVVAATACDNRAVIGQQNGGRGGGTPGTAGTSGGPGGSSKGGSPDVAGTTGTGAFGGGGIGGTSELGRGGGTVVAGDAGAGGTAGFVGRGGSGEVACPQQPGGAGGSSFAFAPVVHHPTYRNPLLVELGDLDGDGKLDFAATNAYASDVGGPGGRGGGTGVSARGGNSGFPGSVSLFLSGESHATPHHYDAGSRPFALAIGDLSGDGKADVVVVNEHEVNVRFNAGGGSLGPTTSLSTGIRPSAVELGDVNGDGKSDMVVANGGQGSPPNGDVAVLVNTGTGSFVASNYAAGASPVGIALGDLDGDGKPDIAAASGTGVSVLLNSGNGAFLGTPSSYGVGTAPAYISSGDVNGDGKPDIAVSNALSGASVLLNTGNGVFTAASNYSYRDVGGYQYPIALGDLNGDGKPDLAVTSRCGIAVLPNAGNGTFGAAQPIMAGDAWAIALGDLNGDGKLDIVFTDAQGVGVLQNLR